MRRTPHSATVSGRTFAAASGPSVRRAHGLLAIGALLVPVLSGLQSEAAWRGVAPSHGMPWRFLAPVQERVPAPSRPLLSQKLQLLESLLGSPAAKKIEASMNPAAKTMLAETGALLDQARALMAADDLAAAAGALDDGLRKISRATALVGKAAPQRSPAQDAARYQRLRRQTEAYVRFLTSQNAAGGPALARLGDLLAQAGEHAAAARYEEASRLLSEAYGLAVATASESRRGQTVVSSLTFETPEQELDYERQRNGSFEMLVEVMLEQVEDPARLRSLADRYIAESRNLRAQAEALAQRGDHPGAIDTMEQATRRLVLMLRAGGLNIPE